MSSFVALGNIAPVDAFVEMTKPVADRSGEQKMALMFLRKGNELARACQAIGRKVGWQNPQTSDWRYLIFARLAKRETYGKAGRSVLVLTPHGLDQQSQLALGMARTSGLHFQLLNSGDNYNVTVRCTCGWSAPLSKNAGHIGSRELAVFGQHRAAVADGTWHKPRSVDEIIAETIARQTAPIVPAQTAATEVEKV